MIRIVLFVLGKGMLDGRVHTPKPGFAVVRWSITHTTGSRGAGLQLQYGHAQRYDDAELVVPRRLFRDHHVGNRAVHCERGGEL